MATVEELPTGATPRTDERVRVQEALRAAGLLVDLSPTMRAQADASMPIEEIRAAVDRAGGPSLSEIVLEQRGPIEVDDGGEQRFRLGASPAERAEAVRRWASLDRPGAPVLPDEALSREQMYD